MRTTRRANRVDALAFAVLCCQRLSAIAGQATEAAANKELQLADLQYANASSGQTLDLYLPQGPGPFPLVVYIHGGGFILGDKVNKTVEEIRSPLLNEGYALASVNYRLTEGGFPDQVRDVKTAVRWLRDNASRFRLATDQIAAWGASAGGNLAAMLGTSCGVESLEGLELGSPDESSCVQAVINWFGPVDLMMMERQLELRSCPVDLTWASIYTGGPLEQNQDIVRAANPMTYITPGDPPMLIEHGTADCKVPPEQSQMLAEALRSLLGDSSVVLEIIDGAEHYDSIFVSPSNIRSVLDFLNLHLK